MRALEAPPNNPRPWLFAVALNLARDDGRRIERRGRRLEVYQAERAGETAPPPDAVLEADERARLVRAALDQLNERGRAALLLKAEGLSYEEIAAALGLAKGAVGTTLARARRRLVEIYRALEKKVGDVARG